MKDRPHPSYRDRIVEEAADWFARLQDPEVTPGDRAAFSDWLSASAEHVREYLALMTLQADMGEVPARQTADDLIKLARDSSGGHVVRGPFIARIARMTHLGTTADEPERKGRRTQWFALAASIALVAIAAAWWLYPNPDDAQYVTAIGEQRSFPLPDGSVVTLNAVSTLQVRFTPQHRDIELLSGEAFFRVAKNPQRPFRVMTSDTVIRAVGTRFNVYHRSAETTVTVVEGVVEISAQSPARQSTTTRVATAPVRVVNGHRARVAAQAEAITVKAVDTTSDVAWRERRLVFESRPLGEVVAEFNLYNETPIELGDPALGTIEVSGSFDANDPRSFASFLDAAQLTRVQTRADSIVLLPTTK